MNLFQDMIPINLCKMRYRKKRPISSMPARRKSSSSIQVFYLPLPIRFKTCPLSTNGSKFCSGLHHHFSNELQPPFGEPAPHSDGPAPKSAQIADMDTTAQQSGNKGIFQHLDRIPAIMADSHFSPRGKALPKAADLGGYFGVIS